MMEGCYWKGAMTDYTLVFILYHYWYMKKLFRVIALLFMFILNGLAVRLPLNGIGTDVISARLTTPITPVWFTFAIWSLIYAGLSVVSFLYLFNIVTFSPKVVQWFVVSCILNGLWILARHYQNLHLALWLIILLLCSLIVICRTLKYEAYSKYLVATKNIFLLYLGWVQIASIIMVTIYCIYQLEVLGSSALWRYVFCVLLLGLINLIILYKEKNITTSLVALWALFGIISREQLDHTLTVLCLIVWSILSVWIIIPSLGHRYKYLLSLPFYKREWKQ